MPDLDADHPWAGIRTCACGCGRSLEGQQHLGSGPQKRRQAKYYNNACRSRAYRARKRAAAQAAAYRPPVVPPQLQHLQPPPSPPPRLPADVKIEDDPGF